MENYRNGRGDDHSGERNDIGNRQKSNDLGAQPSRYNGVESHRTEERFPESGVNRDQTNLHSQRDQQGYRRSDERIREIITDLIEAEKSIDGRDVDVRVHNGEVSVRGYVPDDDARRKIQTIIDRVPGIRDVSNSLRVNPHAAD